MSDIDFLTSMALRSEERAGIARARCSAAELLAKIRDLGPVPRLHLSSEGFDLITESKLRSPAFGQLCAADQDDLEQRVTTFAQAGAAAVSVLTEPFCFDGTLEHLERAALVLRDHAIPVMRKDFLVDPYQVLEARVAGAGGVLLILRMLRPDALGKLFDTAIEQELFVLLEAFDEHDIDAALRLIELRIGSRSVTSLDSVVLLGINCRDLVSLEVVPGRLEALAPKLPSWLPRVAESGLTTADDVGRLAAAGYDLALVGSALMSGDHPLDLAAQMLTAGRMAKRLSCS